MEQMGLYWNNLRSLLLFHVVDSPSSDTTVDPAAYHWSQWQIPVLCWQSPCVFQYVVCWTRRIFGVHPIAGFKVLVVTWFCFMMRFYNPIFIHIHYTDIPIFVCNSNWNSKAWSPPQFTKWWPIGQLLSTRMTRNPKSNLLAHFGVDPLHLIAHTGPILDTLYEGFLMEAPQNRCFIVETP